MSALGGFVSKMFNLGGAASTLVCGRSGGLQAIIHAFELLRRNPTQQAMVVVLADELSPLFYRLFSQTGKLAPKADLAQSLVYDSTSAGAILGEGAAAFVLEKVAEERSVRSSLAVSGYGLTSDSETSGAPQPQAFWFSQAIRQAIEEAKLTPAQIDLIYGHGSGFPCEDARELRALAQVCQRSVPFGCVLPNTGLAESASAGFSLAAAVLSLQHGEAYPLVEPANSSSAWNFIRSRPVRLALKNVLLTGSSDAGNNAALVLTQNEGGCGTRHVQ
jgi:3-oxoacyl-(acyl-carrier-protein) synthase